MIGKTERVAAQLGKLGGLCIIPTATDRVLWKHSKDGVFSVKSAYKSSPHGMNGGAQYPWGTSGRVSCLPK